MTRIEELYKDYLGEVTNFDMFGLPLYENSKAYLIYNIGETRESLIDFLKLVDIKVIATNGPYSSTTVYLEDYEVQKKQIIDYDDKLIIVQMV